MIQAAETLNCSVLDLWEHPERFDLMSIAMAYRRGKSEGEYVLQRNPAFIRKARAERKELEKLHG